MTFPCLLIRLEFPWLFPWPWTPCGWFRCRRRRTLEVYRQLAMENMSLFELQELSPDSNGGWPNVDPMSVLWYQHWTNIGPTVHALWVGWMPLVLFPSSSGQNELELAFMVSVKCRWSHLSSCKLALAATAAEMEWCPASLAMASCSLRTVPLYALGGRDWTRLMQALHQRWKYILRPCVLVPQWPRKLRRTWYRNSAW